VKLHGKKVEGPRVGVVVIPRLDKDLVFKAQAVLDHDDFDKLYPEPQPPEILRPGGEKSNDVTDKSYLAKVERYSEARTNWMMLKSLSATPGLEWETVDMKNPKTWGNWRKELIADGFSIVEINSILECIVDACGLSAGKIEEATKRFLATQAEARRKQSSPSIGPKSTQSGELASVSESDQTK